MAIEDRDTALQQYDCRMLRTQGPIFPNIQKTPTFSDA
jgi:hypothetical protein